MVSETPISTPEEQIAGVQAVLEQMERQRTRNARWDEVLQEGRDKQRKIDEAVSLRLMLELEHGFRCGSKPYRDFETMRYDIYAFVRGLRQQLKHVQHQITNPGDLVITVADFRKDTDAILHGLEQLGDMVTQRGIDWSSQYLLEYDPHGRPDDDKLCVG